MLDDGGLDGGVVSTNCGERGHTNNTLRGIVEARAGLCGSTRSVRVVGLRFNWFCLGVVPGSAVHTTVATEIALEERAGDEVLLGELVEGAVEDSLGALKRASSGESPAGTALTLILDGVNDGGSHGGPVDRGGESNGVGGSEDFVSLVVLIASDVLKTEQPGLLLSSPVGEVVVAMDRGGLGGVELFDLGVNVTEALISELVLLNIGVGLAVLGDVLDEFKVLRVQDLGVGNGDEGDSGERSHSKK